MALHHWKKKERESGTLAVYIGAFIYSAVIIFFCVFIFFRDDYKEKQRLTQFYGYLFAERISRQFHDLSNDLLPLYTLASVKGWGIEDFNTHFILLFCASVALWHPMPTRAKETSCHRRRNLSLSPVLMPIQEKPKSRIFLLANMST